jgi:ABC-2 type transport system ATP-binding protein
MDQLALDVRGVRKLYGLVVALEAVTFALAQGRFAALLGPNGAGKSTLFQLLSGLFAPDRGTIRVAGYDMAKAPHRALAHVGIVFQQPTVDLELSGEANLHFFAALHGLSRSQAQARIDILVPRFALNDVIRKKAGDLSGGNRRRVELARALIHEPRILLMDEPTVGLDPKSRSDLLAHVRALAREDGVAVLWATHLCDEVHPGDQLIVLNKGAVLFDDLAQRLGGADDQHSLESEFLALVNRSAA